LDNIVEDYSSATLSWTVPSNGVDGGNYPVPHLLKSNDKMCIL